MYGNISVTLTREHTATHTRLSGRCLYGGQLNGVMFSRKSQAFLTNMEPVYVEECGNSTRSHGLLVQHFIYDDADGWKRSEGVEGINNCRLEREALLAEPLSRCDAQSTLTTVWIITLTQPSLTAFRVISHEINVIY